MKRPSRRQRVKPKQALLEASQLSKCERQQLADRVRYQGSPFHKRYPADYGFPEPKPRPDKTLCDADAPLLRAQAQELLMAGVLRGIVSVQFRSGWPQNIWSVREGIVYESQLQNQTLSEYHGYPTSLDAAFAAVILLSHDHPLVQGKLTDQRQCPGAST